MAEIVAADFSRLSADDAPTIAANLSRFTSEVQALKAEYEQKFLDIPPSANLYALTDRFVYLTNEFGLFVDGYFLEQDVRWTDDDFAGLADLIESNGITHVLHHWQPDAAIEVAIGEAGAQLVILQDVDGLPLEDDATPDPDTYLATLRADLEMLYAALSEDLL